MGIDSLCNVLHGLFVAIDVEAPEVHDFCKRGEAVLDELRERMGQSPRIRKQRRINAA